MQAASVRVRSRARRTTRTRALTWPGRMPRRWRATSGSASAGVTSSSSTDSTRAASSPRATRTAWPSSSGIGWVVERQRQVAPHGRHRGDRAPGQRGRSICSAMRGSAARSRRMSGSPLRSMRMRSSPSPMARPLTAAGSSPLSASSAGSASPHSPISIQSPASRTSICSPLDACRGAGRRVTRCARPGSSAATTRAIIAARSPAGQGRAPAHAPQVELVRLAGVQAVDAVAPVDQARADQQHVGGRLGLGRQLAQRRRHQGRGLRAQQGGLAHVAGVAGVAGGAARRVVQPIVVVGHRHDGAAAAAAQGGAPGAR